MEIGQLAMMAIVPLAVGGYYWWTVGRKGGISGYMNRRLGLREGEQIARMWMGYFDIDRTTGEKLGELVGVRTRGINIMIALTNQHRLAIGSNETEMTPIGFERGQVMVSGYAKAAEIGTIAGPTGGMEKAQVALLTPLHGGHPFRIQIATSGLQALTQWSQPAG